ncbi:hypothetical protein K458DRAFT_404141 [Lentithecium fluviatile CBS 122367]|uniref:Uncharacterized protein n=1 Tax=Lentithecium fluviatile CBS 122367 TaxID=1168545 RepID=A0A6G1J1Y8_9PLEO|nr:hypothetical protein K458DRAFT_404141 [Lentithecium fluviatile CBS 122367]
MHILPFIHLTLLLLPILAIATPTPDPEEAPARGAPAAVFICPRSNWAGGCQLIPASEAVKCHEPTENSYINSFGPDQGGYCEIYYGWGCQRSTRIRIIRHPGVAERLERFTSWKCYVR